VADAADPVDEVDEADEADEVDEAATEGSPSETAFLATATKTEPTAVTPNRPAR